MRSLGTIIQDSFNYGGMWCQRLSIPGSDNDKRTVFMVVPVSEDSFELPLFALGAFDDGNRTANNFEDIAIALKCKGSRSHYKSLDAQLRAVLNTDFSWNRLVKINTVPDKTYYGTCGAIFDKDFDPIMMQTWEIQRVDEGSEKKYRFVKPVLHIDSDIYICKSNPMERYIANKIVNTVLANTFHAPSSSFSNDTFIRNSHGERFSARVVIDKCPFSLKKIETPSISTSNENILKVALDNIDDVMV